jgi:hypothetical protein
MVARIDSIGLYEVRGGGPNLIVEGDVLSSNIGALSSSFAALEGRAVAYDSICPTGDGVPLSTGETAFASTLTLPASSSVGDALEIYAFVECPEPPPQGGLVQDGSVAAPGTGYLPGDQVTILGGDGGAVVTFTDEFTPLEVVNPGSNYTEGVYDVSGGAGEGMQVYITASGISIPTFVPKVYIGTAAEPLLWHITPGISSVGAYPDGVNRYYIRCTAFLKPGEGSYEIFGGAYAVSSANIKCNASFSYAGSPTLPLILTVTSTSSAADPTEALLKLLAYRVTPA